MANIFTRLIKKALGYRLGGSAISPLEIPPSWNLEGYLRAYGEIGWLFGAVSLIANSVAAVQWNLFDVLKEPREKILKHPGLDLFRIVNPFQTRYEFFQLLQMYLDLVGEAYVLLNFNKLNLPAEMWLIPPQHMSPVQESGKYISYYLYRQGVQKVRLEIQEIIHIINPNPVTPYHGLGPAQSITTDLDSEKYASQYTQRLFYNDATPGVVIEYPEVPPREERIEIRKEWEEIHRGWKNARKPAFLWGGAKINTIAMTNRDMDFWRLRMINREVILGAYHIPASLMGLETVGSRARAEADEYIFAKYTVKPRLIQAREAFNEQLLPKFGENLDFDFENPVPEDREEIRNLVIGSIITREEARERLGYPPKPGEGQIFLMPFNIIAQTSKAVKKEFSNEWKAEYWKRWAGETEGYEKVVIGKLREMFGEQEKNVLEKLTITPSEILVIEDLQKDYEEVVEKPLTNLMTRMIQNAIELVPPKPAHRQIGELLVEAQKWLKKHLRWAAEEISRETMEKLTTSLAEGWKAGEDMRKLKDRVKEYFEGAEDYRALRIARTETISASNEASVIGYESVGVERVEFYPAPDACEICLDLAGREFPVEKAHDFIPVHPNCRCTWLPVV